MLFRRLECAVALAMLVTGTCATTVRAEDHGMFPLKEVVRGLAGEKVPVRGLFAAAGIGWAPKPRVSIQGEIGYAWGVNDTGLLGSTSVYHLSLAPHMRLGGEGARMNTALLFGRTSFGIGSGGFAAGPDLQWRDDYALGGITKIRFGYGPMVLYGILGVLADGGAEWHFAFGLEVFRVP